MVPYKRLPRDGSGDQMQEFAVPFVALTADSSENNAVSSLITLTDNTTVLEVGAVGSGAVLKWISTGNTNPSVISAAGTANFDNFIAPNTVRRFAIPIESFVAQSSIVGLNKQYGLYNRVAVKSVGASSVLTTQY